MEGEYGAVGVVVDDGACAVCWEVFGAEVCLLE